MNRILVVGDCHIDDDQDLTRFDLLSKLILDQQPTHIVLIGDFLTLNCLSAWDMDKRKSMENKRYRTEIEAGRDALGRFIIPLELYNIDRRKQKKKQYEPELVYMMGNHEDRLTRYLENDPTFDGFVSIERDLCLTDLGFKVVPYRAWYEINDIWFTHIPHNEVRPVTGKLHIHRASETTVNSIVYGHTHKLELLNRHVQGMEHLQQILNCGCFFEKHEPYVDGRVTHYWKGVVLLNNYKPGRFDMETWSIGRMRRTYGDTTSGTEREDTGEVR